ncbi:GMC family oxidoreductase N-terminal domain-containing protein [Nordella sp. HKS 07]|uniref:GMC family oxidoreductase N-terminal domain-containing protein n=1 Tax=Nordella sp. HKS 07 TaxID=2712222 RepID=UPI001FEEB5DB|nr:GMC family oxidoreductase N-terminal domain-containing protein [Nordella sp. HKS 07]
MTASVQFDYIIVGGGSAGAIVANRLSADPKLKVLLLEAGPADRDSDWTVRMPAAMGINFERAKYNYLYNSEPEPYLNGRQVFHPRGKILGGSSSINGMCYTRGNPNDYERWVSEGAAGWSYSEVLPYFKRLESFEGGDDLYRGRSGPVKVRNGPLSFPSYNTFLAAGEQAGYPRTQDINGYQQEGFGLFDRNTDNGVRASTSWAYLRPVRDRKTLRVVTEAVVDRVLMEQGGAVGVAYIQGGVRHEVRAAREVILSAGAFNSPQILLRSGIGAEHGLRELGIEVAHDLPGVGQNLQDHLEFYLCWTCPKGGFAQSQAHAVQQDADWPALDADP